jgi:hypothetical protein
VLKILNLVLENVQTIGGLKSHKISSISYSSKIINGLKEDLQVLNHLKKIAHEGDKNKKPSERMARTLFFMPSTSPDTFLNQLLLD